VKLAEYRDRFLTTLEMTVFTRLRDIRCTLYAIRYTLLNKQDNLHMSQN
jgi:hypothetical protein